MKYEYDLKKLIADNEHTDVESAYREMLNTQALLAIAERLEALVEAQKPRWVEFGEATGDGIVIIDANCITGIDDFGGYVAIDTSNATYDVKGTLAEVMAKIRGGQ